MTTKDRKELVLKVPLGLDDEYGVYNDPETWEQHETSYPPEIVRRLRLSGDNELADTVQGIADGFVCPKCGSKRCYICLLETACRSSGRFATICADCPLPSVNQ